MSRSGCCKPGTSIAVRSSRGGNCTRGNSYRAAFAATAVGNEIFKDLGISVMWVFSLLFTEAMLLKFHQYARLFVVIIIPPFQHLGGLLICFARTGSLDTEVECISNKHYGLSVECFIVCELTHGRVCIENLKEIRYVVGTVAHKERLAVVRRIRP